MTLGNQSQSILRYLQTVRRSHSLLLLAKVLLLAALTTACETVPPEVAKAQSAREQAFRETLVSYKPMSSDESAVIALLKTYRDAYNASDLSRIERLLTSDFDLRYYKPRSEDQYTVMVQSRSRYLEKRTAWSPKHPRQEKLIVNVRSVLLHPEGKGAVVVAATTYKSKFFHPRYIETYGFKRTSAGWSLRRILVLQATPKPEELNVSVSFADVDYGYLRDPKFVAAYGPDALFAKYIQPSCCLSTERQKLLVVFAEPPAPGAGILVRETQIGRGRTFESYTISSPHSRYYFLIGVGWEGSGYNVLVEVEVDGVLVARKTL